MKKFAAFTFLAITLINCKMYVQVFDTSSLNTKADKGFYVFENDSLKIIYDFWSQKGLMSFLIYNKLDKPLYIDWKKSSYIDNSTKLNYWVDEEISNSISYFGSYYYDGPPVLPGFMVSETASISVSKTTKIERVTFIPPKSKYYRSQFYIFPVSSYKMDLNSSYNISNRNDKPNKTTKVYEKIFTKENTPINFRNFLTFSFSENFSNEFYVNNEFFVSDIKEIDERHFEFYKIDKTKNVVEKDDDGNYLYVRPFQKGTSFYIRIPKEESIDSRK